jgi:hypothetical protein
MSEISAGHPSIYEELNRKTVDALVWLEESLEQGELTPEQGYAARQALFMALSGLLSPDVNSLLSSALVDRSAVHQEICIRDNVIAVLTINQHGNVIIHRASIDAARMNVKRFADNDKPFRLLKRVRERLTESGFQKFI